MAKFEIEWTEESWYRTTIEADTEDQALAIWTSGDYPEYPNLKPYGGEIQDGVDINELEND
jgi:hypothetical protein